MKVFSRHLVTMKKSLVWSFFRSNFGSWPLKSGLLLFHQLVNRFEHVLWQLMLLENFIFTDSRDLKYNCQLPVIVLFCIVIAILKLVLKFETFNNCPLLSDHQLIKQTFRGFQVRKVNTRFNVLIPIWILINNVAATNVLDHELDVNAHLMHLDRLIRIQILDPLDILKFIKL